MSLTTRKLSQCSVGFNPMRTTQHKVMIFISCAALLAFFVWTIEIFTVETVTFRVFFIFAGTGFIVMFLGMITLFANSFGDKKVGFWFRPVDKHGKMYGDKVDEFYENIPNKGALSYLCTRRDRDDPNGDWSAYEHKELFSGNILLHRKIKEIKGGADAEQLTEKNEEFQVERLPDRLKIETF